MTDRTVFLWAVAVSLGLWFGLLVVLNAVWAAL